MWMNVFKFLDVDSCEIACEVFGKPADRAWERAVCVVIVKRFRLTNFTCRTKASEFYDKHAARGDYVQMMNWRMKLEKESNVESMYTW